RALADGRPNDRHGMYRERLDRGRHPARGRALGRAYGASARRPVPDLRPGEDASAGLTPARPVGILAEDGHGIAVARALQRLLPREDLLLLCDDAYAPHARRRPAVGVARGPRL